MKSFMHSPHAAQRNAGSITALQLESVLRCAHKTLSRERSGGLRGGRYLLIQQHPQHFPAVVKKVFGHSEVLGFLIGNRRNAPLG